MDSKSLMIGDWASMSETDDIVPCVVTALHPEDLFVIQPGEDAGDVLSYDTIYPIPLTPEILEKNGFIFHNEHITWFNFTNDDVHIEIDNGAMKFWFDWRPDDYNTYCDYILPYPMYVHEFQRALRCCGLWQLANDFKV